MSQASLVLDAQKNGTDYTTDANAALDALKTLFSGPAAPTVPSAYMLWADTTTATLKQRNAANTAWIRLGPLAGVVPGGTSRNLALVVTDAALTQCTVTADALSIAGTQLLNFSATLLTSIGLGLVGGLGGGGGSWTANTWYEVIATCNDDGSSSGLQAIPSGSSWTNPPAGHTRSQHVGWVRTQAITTNLFPIRQVGPIVQWRGSSADHIVLGTTSSPSATYADVDCASHVPPGVRLIDVIPTLYSDATIVGTPGNGQFLRLRENGATLEGRDCGFVLMANAAAVVPTRLACDASRIIEYRVVLAGGWANTDLNVGIVVDGWVDGKVA